MKKTQFGITAIVLVVILGACLAFFRSGTASTNDATGAFKPQAPESTEWLQSTENPDESIKRLKTL